MSSGTTEVNILLAQIIIFRIIPSDSGKAIFCGMSDKLRLTTEVSLRVAEHEN